MTRGPLILVAFVGVVSIGLTTGISVNGSNHRAADHEYQSIVDAIGGEFHRSISRTRDSIDAYEGLAAYICGLHRAELLAFETHYGRPAGGVDHHCWEKYDGISPPDLAPGGGSGAFDGGWLAPLPLRSPGIPAGGGPGGARPPGARGQAVAGEWATVLAREFEARRRAAEPDSGDR